MPFIYHGRPIDIDRSEKREDAFILDTIDFSLEEMLRSGRGSFANSVLLLPTSFEDKSFNEVDSNIFFVNKCLGKGLSWFEIEHFLDEILWTNFARYYLMRTSLAQIDERRKYYTSDKRFECSCPYGFLSFNSEVERAI